VIAQRHGVTIQVIREANPGVDPYALRVGQSIRIPLPTITPQITSSPAQQRTPTQTPTLPGEAPASPTPGVIIYIIRVNDNFSRIAQRFGISVEAILEANPGVNPYALRVGQPIRIPLPTITPSPTPLPTITPSVTPTAS
jgi:LysM repeat protein